MGAFQFSNGCDQELQLSRSRIIRDGDYFRRLRPPRSDDSFQEMVAEEKGGLSTWGLDTPDHVGIGQMLAELGVGKRGKRIC